MSTQLYTLAEVYWNGRKLAEEASVKVARDSKAQVVATVARGFAGMSPGAKDISISVENAVPAADFELNPGEYIDGLVAGEITVFAAGKTLSSKGFIIKDDFSHAVNSEAKLSFDFVGEFADWS